MSSQEGAERTAIQTALDCLTQDQGVLPESGIRLYRILATDWASISGTYIEDRVNKIIDRARRGSHDDHLVLCDIARDMWKAGHVPFASLEDYIFRALIIRPPTRKAGASPYKNLSRNLSITSAVLRVRDKHGLKLTRNLATRENDSSESASSVVAQALALIGINMTEEGVKDAYTRVRNLMKEL